MSLWNLVMGRRTPISSYLALFVLLGLALIQSSWGQFLTISGVHPDFVLMAVVSWTLLHGAAGGILWAIVGGLCLDLFSGGPFGLTVIPLILVSLLATLGHGRVLGGYLMLPLILAFPASLSYYLIQMLLLDALGRSVAWGTTLMHVVLPASLLNTLVILFLFPLLRLLHRHTGREQMQW
jgi:rod shape-determining protein MreD